MAKPWLTVIALLLALLVPVRGFAAVMLTACLEERKPSAIAMAAESTTVDQGVTAPCDDADCHNACEQLLSACLLPLVQPTTGLVLLAASAHSVAAHPHERFFNAETKLRLRPPTFQS